MYAVKLLMPSWSSFEWICCYVYFVTSFAGGVQIEVVFSSSSANGMREAAKDLINRLAQTAKETFGDFEDAVATDATKTPVLDGTVHPLTSYVINYVKFLFE